MTHAYFHINRKMNSMNRHKTWKSKPIYLTFYFSFSLEQMDLPQNFIKHALRLF